MSWEDLESVKDRVEGIHTEAKSFRSETSNMMHQLDKRISRVEFLGEQTQERLNSGNAAFAKVAQQVDDVRAKIDTPWYKVVGFLMPALFSIAAVIWQMARNPSGEEFEKLKRDVWEVQSQNKAVDAKLDLIIKQQMAPSRGPLQP